VSDATRPRSSIELTAELATVHVHRASGGHQTNGGPSRSKDIGRDGCVDC
jgi:hypothetical protein